MPALLVPTHICTLLFIIAFLAFQMPVLLVPTHICTLLFIIAFLAFQMPVLLVPAGDDPDNVKPGGEVASLVEGKGGASVVFPEMKHGWYMQLLLGL